MSDVVKVTKLTQDASSQVDMLRMVIEDVFGQEGWDDSSTDTARRVLNYWLEYTNFGPPQLDLTCFDATANQMVVVRDIAFSSMCGHHLLPFHGYAHVAYLPNELMIGLSKIPRIVEWFSKRPTTQEVLTKEIASYLKHTLQAMGVAVIVESHHTCMSCRGIAKHEASMTTSEMRGVFLTGEAAKNEFLQLISRPRI